MRYFKSMRYLCVAAFLGSALWTTSVVAATGGFAQYETELFELINWARQNPVEAAERVGMTPPSNDAMSDLRVDSILAATASEHTLEMAEYRYYGYISRDGRTPEERIIDMGYNGGLVGEMLGLVTFRNYLPPETAVDILFRQLLKRDLQQYEAGGDTYIFNPDMEEIGIAMTAGRVEMGRSTYNGYILTCDFGKPADQQESIQNGELVFLDLLNRVRTAPVEELSKLGVDVAGYVMERPELEAFLSAEMAPVTYAPSFREIAFSRNQAAFETIFSGAEGEVLTSREDHGSETHSDYFAVSGELTVAYQDRGELTREDVLRLIFQKLLEQDLNADDLSGMFLLKSDLQEISVVFGHRQINSGGKLIQQYVLTSACGSGYLTLLEKQSLNLLNQARAAYGETNEQTETPEIPGPEAEPENQEVSNTEEPETISLGPLQPLTVSHIIYDTAEKHALEMIEYAYKDYYSHDGSLDLGERLDLAGYPSFAFHEEIELELYEAEFDVETVAADKFDGLLMDASGPTPDSESLFSPFMENAGIRILYTPPMVVEESNEPAQGTTGENIAEVIPNSFQRVHTLLIVVDVAESLVEKTEGVLVTIVYEDTDLDGRYDRGEELAYSPVDIYCDRDQASYRVYTDDAGSLSIPLKAGTYELTLAETEDSKDLVVDMVNENMLVTLPVQSLPEVPAEIQETNPVNAFFPTGADETIVDIE